MKRLRDQRGSADPVLARAAELVSARPPLEDDAVRRQRVRARLRRRRTAPRGAAWLRAAAMVLLVCSVAMASAMIGRVAQTIRAHLEEARAARQEQHAHAHRHHAPAPVAAPERESDEQRLLVDAVRALRHEHDPARAERLLERYLDRFPDAVAAEDALALALEATIGRDPPRAAGFATRYLARYPSGRWAALARRALDP